MVGILSSSHTNFKSSALWILFWVLSPNQAMFLYFVTFSVLNAIPVRVSLSSTVLMFLARRTAGMMSPVVPSESKGVLTAVKDMHYSAVVVATQNSSFKT